MTKQLMLGLLVLGLVGALTASELPPQYRAGRGAIDSLAEAGRADSALTVALDLIDCLGEQLPDTAYGSLSFDLGMLFFSTAKYAQADSVWQLALMRTGRVLPDHDPLMIGILRYSGTAALVLGDYGRAEQTVRRGLAAWQLAENPDTTYGIRANLHLGVIAMNQGRTEDAETAYRRALEVLAGRDADFPEAAAGLRNNLCNLYRVQGRSEDVEQILLDQIAALEPTPDVYRHIRLAAYHNLAETYTDLERWEEAEQYFRISIDSNRTADGSRDKEVAYALTSVASLYLQQKRFDEAADACREALELKRAAADLADRSVANTLTMYSRAVHAQGNLTRAMELAAEAFEIRHANFVRNSWALPEEQALRYAGVMRGAASCFLTPYSERADWRNEVLDRRAAEVILRAKGPVSDAVFERQRALAAQSDPEVAGLMASLQETSRQLSSLYMQGLSGGYTPENYRNVLDSLTRRADSLERGLALLSDRFLFAQGGRRVTCDQVTSALGDAVLVEYIKFEHHNLAAGDPEDHYLVLVIRPDGAIAVRPLGPAAVIERSVRMWRAGLEAVGESWPQADRREMSRYQSQARQLYDMIWRPVEPLLKQDDMVLIAPDAGLNLISFGALPGRGTPYLIEEHPIHYLSAGRDLASRNSHPADGSGLLAVGDIDYGGMPKAPEIGESTRVVSQLRQLPPLPYTKREIDQVIATWEDSHAGPVTRLDASRATESAVREAAPGKAVLHIATHGFFASTVESSGESEVLAGLNPLLSSGLYLAGANALSADSIQGDDGVLTAWEVLAMDLSGTDRVVLSACESGLGEVMTGEGVYGLRRAFLMSGARTVISSLWAVPDKQTAAFMNSLYRSGQGDLARRMQEICLARLEELRSKGRSDHPFSWGAFIAVGDWTE